MEMDILIAMILIVVIIVIVAEVTKDHVQSMVV